RSYHSAFGDTTTSLGPWRSHTLRMTTRPPVRQTSAGAARLHSAHNEVVVLSRASVTTRDCHRAGRNATDRARYRAAFDRGRARLLHVERRAEIAEDSRNVVRAAFERVQRAAEAVRWIAVDEVVHAGR